MFTFGIAGAILTESSLSFLGFGGDALQGISWGSLLESVRMRPSAWWVGIPPGLAIALTVLIINKAGELLSDNRR
jgi:peptide/nickel transport system permease protein